MHQTLLYAKIYRKNG